MFHNMSPYVLVNRKQNVYYMQIFIYYLLINATSPFAITV